MLNLSEYRHRSDRLADHLPWAALIAPGVVLNKDGSFQRTLRFRGPDLESATEAELISACARANNVLKRFGTGWALFFEAERREASAYPDSAFPDPASWLVDQERRANFLAEGEHYESRYYLTLTWLPTPDSAEAAGRSLVERPEADKGRDWHGALASFIVESDRALDLLGSFMPEVRALDDAETLTFLHGTVSCRQHRVAVPETPIYLDALLTDTPLTGGLEPRLGDTHIRTLTVLGFPSMSRPGILDALNHQDFAYRWVTRFIALDKSDATKALTRLRRQWFNKRKSITALLREIMYNQPSQLLDTDADNKVVDADLALQVLGGDHVAFGYLTTTITVTDADRGRVEDKVRQVERIVNGLGFTTIREGVNAVEAWLSSLPGQVYANVRQPLVHTLNLAHVMPLSSVWAGPARNAHLDGPPLLHASTAGSTPFRLSTHVGDVGHMLVVGPTGAGKSVLLALIALQFRRYADSQVYIFDKGFSARAAVLAMGGAHHALGLGADAGETLAFQPLRRIDDATERSWAAEWIAALLAHERVIVTPEVKDAVWSALGSLASAPPEERTLTGLTLLLQSNALRTALGAYTLDGPYGRLLDAAEQHLAFADVQCFETEALMGQTGVVAPVLTYLFHRLEERFNGRPTLLILDEAWIFLDHPLFAARIREWLKVLRKKNVAVLFATQSLADIASSSIAPAIIESCPQRILLPNDRAIEPQSREAYERFGLNVRQIELVSRATPKRQYYLQSARGNRLFELGLGPVALTLCGASDPATQARIDAMIAEGGQVDFAARFLVGAGLGWAADLLPDFPAPQA
ncbi:conjugal transfer protein TrbE [Rhizorhabdus dicambivorans]|uniref:Conjugal transfer protein TrbE n=1 Tax=Rhizorhabdus dicambivorans TaxID=1850238 RepID=A0A2A4FTJ9_9SPHN|nr:conjugal transfer protein TrbE [Rhizorhabdus dicambivorans]ATE65668.1 conjugal transfer protein TrbE [Rhizorhabdus dicambivorans]PCE41012.1 conjugal transfer protein TrbE [Rhizorhabdus dicambivorans]